MTDNGGSVQAKAPSFRALLTPYRSLSPAGFVVFMGSLSAISFVTGMIFYLSGAWPVMGFFGLDVLIIYIAFRLNYRSGRIYEVIEMTDSELAVTRVYPSGKSERHGFNPYWARVRLDEGPDGRTALAITSHGSAFPLGRFLTDDERRDFAGILEDALRDARGGQRI
jgi:uncharacterized membrane protein